jgi:two-component system NtrC family sensor kinase
MVYTPWSGSEDDHHDPREPNSVPHQEGGNETVGASSSETNIIILGAGKGGTALLESFLNLPEVRVLGIADKDPGAPGLKLAQFHHIPTAQTPLELLQKKDIHLIVNVTGDPATSELLADYTSPGTEVLGGSASKVFWNLIQHQAHVQEQLFQAEKLAGFGTFASGIAHDINNPLYIILAMAEAIQGETDITEIHHQAASIHEAAKRVQTISQDITQYARVSSSEESVKVYIDEQLDEALKIARFATKFQEITIHKHCQDGLTVNAKPEEIFQVFVNLLTNAIQAMEGKGSLTLSTEKKNSHIQISISDTGCGISSKDLQKIFDPFFTTKEVGKGTGLGLYNVRTIVRKYQGELNVESAVGKGTKFILVFPCFPSN